MQRELKTLLDVVEARAETHVDRPIYTFLTEEGTLAPSFGELFARARRVAGALQRLAEPGDRALLLFPFGEDVVVGLLASLLAGVACVPLPASGRRGISFLPAARDSGARVVLSNLATRARLEGDHSAGIAWVCVDDPGLEGSWSRPPTGPEDVAWLQYTSGSTGAPRGVRVLHRNAVANARDIGLAWGLGPRSRAVCWVPHYHDDGLVNGLLQPLFHGFRTALMDPLAFISRPERWLRAITAERATHAGGPNFTYEVTLRKVGPEEREGLDLSSWEMAYNAAEPVRADTLRRFWEAFAPYGLRWTTLRPAYGMAETTLLVTTSPTGTGPLLDRFDGPALRERGLAEPPRGEEGPGDVAWLASSGRVVPGTRVAIWDPATGAPLPDGAVGEILVQGPGVTDGYWQRPEVNADIFGARLPDQPGTWLRTGDLGFLREGELFVTGRHKDLIIIAGVNYYPQDIEAAVEASDPAFRPGCSAAFGVDLPDEAEEAVVVVAEVKGARPGDAARLAERAQQAIGAALGLRLHALTLLPPEHLPKTSSGKVRRRPTRAAWLAGELNVTDAWVRPAAPAPAPSARDLRERVIAEVARAAGLDPARVRPDVELAALGLRSIDAAAIAAALSASLGVEIPTVALFEHPTVDRLCRFLAEGAPAPRAARPVEAGEPLAILGFACRLPGADSPEAFWRMVEAGEHAITPVPEERWRLWEEWDPEIRHNPRLALRTGGFLERLQELDAEFFGISPREAAQIDPQQRLALELCWEALQDAGVPPERLAGTATGVFAAALDQEYGRRLMSYGHESLVTAWSGTGGALSILANRLSYLLDLHGPSLTVDTACSSGLTALLLAANSLRRGESGAALVLATNLLLTPGATINFSEAGALSKSGHPRPFDARADGFVRSEGAVALLLKPLGAALADGDRIRAVLRGGAIVQDGRTNGLMAPSGSAQEATVRQALQDAGVAAEEVSYVECHGTGTPLGDPIELNALGAVHAPARSRPLVIGSAKANVGHLEAAAGLVGVLKAALALEHRRFPPVAGLGDLNPAVDAARLNLDAPREARAWEGPLVAGVSSFGFGGTNTHVILEAAPPLPSPAEDPPGPWFLPLSARSREALLTLAADWRRAVLGPERLADLLYTATAGRPSLPWRAAAIGVDRASLAEALSHVQAQPSAAPGAPVWLLSGHGSQHAAMGEGLPLRAYEQGLSAALDAVRAAGAELPWPLGEADLDRVDRVQPAIFAVQLAIGTALEALGQRPAAVLGQSMGEVAAAALAGALSLHDAARVIVARSRLLATVEGEGAMLAVPLPAERLDLEPGLVVAVESAPGAVVVAGPPAAVARLEERLRAEGVDARRVRTGVAFHTPPMERLAEPLRRELEGLRPRRASLPLWSTVSGARLSGEELGPAYWARNLVETVRFSTALGDLLAALGPALPAVELSPHPLLGAAARALGVSGFSATLRRDRPPLAMLQELYERGYRLRWEVLYPEGRRVSAPHHPWRRERHWTEVPPRRGAAHGLLGRPTPLAEGERRSWSSDLGGMSFLREHRLGDAPLLPAAALLEAARAAGEEALGGPVVLEQTRFEAPWFLDEASWTLGLTLEGEAGGARWTASSPAAVIATGRLRREAPAPPPAPEPAGVRAVDGSTFHADFEARGLVLGPAFQAVRALRVAHPRAEGEEGAAEAELSPPAGLPPVPGARLHPALLDAALRVASQALDLGEGLWAPAGLRRLVVQGPLLGAARVSARARRVEGRAEADLWISTPSGAPVAVVSGLEVRRIAAPQADDRLYGVQWEPVAWPPAVEPVAVSLLRCPEAERLGEALAKLGCAVALRDPEQADGGGLVVDARPLRAPADVAGLSEALAATLALVDRLGSGRLAVLLPGGVVGAAFAGALRAARLERSSLDILVLEAEDDADATARALLSADETELRLVGGARLARRLVRARPRGRAVALGEGLVILSGGLGALGLVSAEALVGAGARELLLLGRGAPSEPTLARVDALRAAGARVEIARLDVTDEAGLRRVIGGRSVAGVIHAAGVLDDAPLGELGAERIAAVLRPKLEGARVLDRLAPEAGFFMLFGSVAGLWGNAGQAAYAAANAALEALAAERRARGAEAVCLHWGPWSEVGMAAEAGALRRAEAMGLGAISPAEGAPLLIRLLGAAGTALGVVPVRWDRFASKDPLFRHLLAAPTGGAPERSILDAVSAAFQIPVDRLDLDTSLVALGLDSVVALDLKGRIQRASGVELPVADLLRGPTLRELIARIGDEAPVPVDPDALSDAEVDALLASLLASDA